MQEGLAEIIMALFQKFLELLGRATMFSVGAVCFAVTTFFFFLELFGFTIEGRRITRNKYRWDSTDIALMAMSAALYGGALTATAGIPVIPGYTWFRPGNALVPVFALFFGLPGCFGCALGNLIADAFGGYLGLGSTAGFLANFMSAYMIYKLVKDPKLSTARAFLDYYLWAVIINGLVVAFTISFFLDLLELLPYFVVWTLFFGNVFFNNLIAQGILGPLVVKPLYGRIKASGLYCKDRLAE